MQESESPSWKEKCSVIEFMQENQNHAWNAADKSELTHPNSNGKQHPQNPKNGKRKEKPSGSKKHNIDHLTWEESRNPEASDAGKTSKWAGKRGNWIRELGANRRLGVGVKGTESRHWKSESQRKCDKVELGSAIGYATLRWGRAKDEGNRTRMWARSRNQQSLTHSESVNLHGWSLWALTNKFSLLTSEPSEVASHY